MHKNYTKSQFFEKMQWEGDFCDMVDYVGQCHITDDIDMEKTWSQFCLAYDDLRYIYDDWAAERDHDQQSEDYQDLVEEPIEE